MYLLFIFLIIKNLENLNIFFSKSLKIDFFFFGVVFIIKF